MQILEQSLIAKNPKKASEDGIVVTADFIAVIDGSTSKTQYRHSLFRSNGRYAMQLASRYIRRMSKESSCEQFLRGVTALFRKHYKKSMLERFTEHPEDRMTCSAIIFSRLKREIWMIGDCMGLITPLSNYQPSIAPTPQLLENPKPYEGELAAMRAAEAERLLVNGHTIDELCRNDIARPVILPRMLETMREQNVTYSVIDGFPIPRQHIRVIPLDFHPWEIVLASDGYPVLCPTLAESEVALQHQLATDPLNIRTFQATKAFHPDNNSFDDRSYIRFRV